MASAVTRKGQVTIPKEIRRSLGIEPGTRVAFELDGQGRAVLRRADFAAEVERLKGLAGFGGWDWPGTTEEFMELTRGDSAE